MPSAKNHRNALLLGILSGIAAPDLAVISLLQPRQTELAYTRMFSRHTPTAAELKRQIRELAVSFLQRNQPQADTR